MRKPAPALCTTERLGAQDLSFRPCLPSHWPRAELTLRRDGRALRFILIRATASEALMATAPMAARLLLPEELLRWNDLPDHTCFVIPLRGASIPAPTHAAAAADLQT